MPESIQAQIDQLQASINGLEAQRSILGDEIVNPALTTLKEKLAALEQQVAVQTAPVEERRMVTILFFDIVGSTGMAEKLDPEEWRRIVAQVHTTLGDVINTHHGTVAQYLGDGLLAFFGSHQAAEHDPENAIRAALDAHTAVANLPLSEKVQLHAGIHTGLVVMGELGNAIHKEFTASGDAMNLAARLQSAAPTGGTLISYDTYRYVRGVFDLTPRPPLTVKGKSEPLQTFLIRRAKSHPFRSLERGVAGIETRTVGREAEMHSLQAAYLRAYEGHGTVWMQLLSDPGIGKSRLLVDMNDWIDLRDETVRLLRARAFPDDVNQPFALVRRMWFDRFQIAEDASLKQAESRWVERFKDLSAQDDCEEASHALGLLVGLPFEDSPFIKAMRYDPTQVKGRAFVVSHELVRSIRKQSPLVILLEDLQWTDLASWEYLMEVFLADPLPEQSNGLFILGAARPEWHPPEELVSLFRSSQPDDKTSKKWGVQISLPPLSSPATRELVQELFQRLPNPPAQVIDLLVERSEGVPYFTEEMINWFIDHGILDTHSEQWVFLPDRLKEQPLPATLQHLLLTRLSSLSATERAALQRGSIFGRRFWSGGVNALGVPAGEETLAHLQPRGFVEEQPESSFLGDTEWSFHQNLLREVTYESVLKRERASLHKLAAGWLEQQARQAGRLEEFAGLLGNHLERAGELSAAADWYLRAGKRAFSQGAPREARDFYTQALGLLPPVDRERRWQVLLGREEALSVLTEAEPWKADTIALLDLAHSFDDDNYLADAYLRQAIYATRVSDIPLSDQAARGALAAAQRCHNEVLEVKALAMLAVADCFRVDQPATLEHIDEAIIKARQLGNESLLSFVLYRGAYCYGEFGDTARSVPLNLEHIELDHHLGDRSQEAIGLSNLGSGYIGMGLYKQGRALLEQSNQIDYALGAHRSLAYNLLNLGAMYMVTGDLRKATELEEEAFREGSYAKDIRVLAPITDTLGRILLATGDAPAAARRFTESRNLALRHGLIPKVHESSAGLAACAMMLGQLDQARTLIVETWEYLKTNSWFGMNDPPWVYLTCAEIFDALADEENLKSVLMIGHQAFMDVANKINVPEWRQSFLENVPTDRAFMDMWERSKQELV